MTIAILLIRIKFWFKLPLTHFKHWLELFPNDLKATAIAVAQFLFFFFSCVSFFVVAVLFVCCGEVFVCLLLLLLLLFFRGVFLVLVFYFVFFFCCWLLFFCTSIFLFVFFFLGGEGTFWSMYKTSDLNVGACVRDLCLFRALFSFYVISVWNRRELSCDYLVM